MSEDKKESKSGGLATKVIAGVFGAIVAPILVALGIQYFSPKEEPKPAPTPAPAPAPDQPQPQGLEQPPGRV